MMIKFLAILLSLFLFINADESKEAKKAKEELIVAVITNTTIPIDDLYKKIAINLYIFI